MQSGCFLCRHPQYAAFYKWLEHDFGADAVLHFGMHGTVEWVGCPAALVLPPHAPELCLHC